MWEMVEIRGHGWLDSKQSLWDFIGIRGAWYLWLVHGTANPPAPLPHLNITTGFSSYHIHHLVTLYEITFKNEVRFFDDLDQKMNSPQSLKVTWRFLIIFWDISLVCCLNGKFTTHVLPLFFLVEKAPDICPYSGSRLLWWMPNTCKPLGAPLFYQRCKHRWGASLVLAWRWLSESKWYSTLVWNEVQHFCKGEK